MVFLEHQNPGWLGYLWGFYLYTNREYHKPIIRIPWNWAVSHAEKIIPIDTCRVVGQDKAAYDFLELHALGYDAWRRGADDFGWQKCLNLDFLVGKKYPTIYPIWKLLFCLNLSLWDFYSDDLVANKGVDFDDFGWNMFQPDFLVGGKKPTVPHLQLGGGSHTHIFWKCSPLLGDKSIPFWRLAPIFPNGLGWSFTNQLMESLDVFFLRFKPAKLSRFPSEADIQMGISLGTLKRWPLTSHRCFFLVDLTNRGNYKPIMKIQLPSICN